MATPTPERREVSAITAAGDAIERVRRQLFPFRFERWLTLGFVAFLEQCGRQGGGFNVPNVPAGRGGGEGGSQVGAVGDWMAAHVTLLVAIAVAVLALVVVVIAVVLWINSRAIFMYIDNVATGRAEVARPWREHAERAGSLFAWRFGLALATLVSVTLLVAAGALVVFHSVRTGFGLQGVLVLIGLVLALLAVVVLAALISFALRDFVAPIQMWGGLSCGAALAVLGGLLRAHPGAFVVFLLLRMVFGLALGIALLLVGCLTCCIGFLPVVSQTIFQPAWYFERAWSLCLLRQLGYDLAGEAATLPA